jgi:WD40 repeat protein
LLGNYPSGALVHDTTTRNVVTNIPKTGYELHLSPDGNWFAACPDTAQRLVGGRVEAPSQTIVFEPDPDWRYDEHIGFSPDGRQLAVHTGGGRVELFDAQNLQRLRTLPSEREHSLGGLAYGGNGTIAVVSGNMALIWELSSSRVIRSVVIPGPQLLVAAYHPKHHLVALGDQAGRVHLWALDRPGAVETIQGSGMAPVRSLSFDPTGEYLAVTERRLLLVHLPSRATLHYQRFGSSAELGWLAWSDQGEWDCQGVGCRGVRWRASGSWLNSTLVSAPIPRNPHLMGDFFLQVPP